MTPREAIPDIALSRAAHDRIAGRRVDDAWLSDAWANPETRVLPIAGTRLRIVGDAVGWLSPEEAPEGVRVLLGDRDGVPQFAVLTDAATAKAPPSGEAYVSIRSALPALGVDGDLVVHAVGLAEWHWATRHCPRCGTALESRAEGHLLHCPTANGGCGKDQFPRTDPAVIMLVVTGEGSRERCLLGRNPGWPKGRYSTLAGFVEPGESLEDAVRREVLEEAGVVIGRVDYLGSQPWPLPASLMVGFVAHAETVRVSVDGEEIEDAQWFTRAELRERAESGELVLPGGISISRTLIETWFGEALPGSW